MKLEIIWTTPLDRTFILISKHARLLGHNIILIAVGIARTCTFIFIIYDITGLTIFSLSSL